MDFAIAAPGGVPPGNPAAIAARGADPLIVIPPAPHLLRRVNGLIFQVGAPGGLAPIANSLPVSTIAGMLGHALAIDQNVANTAADEPVLLSGCLPAKYEAVIARLHAEPAHSLQPNAIDL